MDHILDHKPPVEINNNNPAVGDMPVGDPYVGRWYNIRRTHVLR